MDIDQADKEEQTNMEGNGEDYGQYGWGGDWNGWNGEVDVDWLGKGGKGYDGKGYWSNFFGGGNKGNNGKDGGGKGNYGGKGGFSGMPFWGKGGKGKGKAMEEKVCYQCGETGHIAFFCPKGKGKGNYPGNKGGGGKGETRECHKCGKAGHLAAQCRVGSVRGVEEPEGEEIGGGGLIEWGDVSQVEWEGKMECEVCWKGQLEELEEEQWNIGDVMAFDGGDAPAWREYQRGI